MIQISSLMPVECKNNRLCGIIDCMANHITILLLNAYMLCDGRSHEHRHAKMVDILREVEYTMLKYDANYTIFGAHLNTDISRNTPHTANLLEFVSEYDMTIYIEMGHVNMPYTYICEWGNETFTSKFDHFIVCKSLCDNIGERFIIDEFYSDHAAVKMSIFVNVPHIDMSNDVIVHSDKVAWHRANDNNIETYKELVNEKFKQIRFDSDLFKCTNVTR